MISGSGRAGEARRRERLGCRRVDMSMRCKAWAGVLRVAAGLLAALALALPMAAQGGERPVVVLRIDGAIGPAGAD